MKLTTITLTEEQARELLQSEINEEIRRCSPLIIPAFLCTLVGYSLIKTNDPLCLSLSWIMVVGAILHFLGILVCIVSIVRIRMFPKSYLLESCIEVKQK